MALGLPNINIVFKELGVSAIQRGDKGIVGLILKDTTQSTFTVYDVTDIPNTLSEENKKYIKDSLIGYTNAPLRVECYVLAGEGQLVDALNYFEGVRFDYLCNPNATTQESSDMATWIKTLRDNEGVKAKAVLSKNVADHEGVINFTQDGIKVGEATYTSSQYLPRITGLLAGTNLQISCTYAPLNEVTEIPHESKDATNARIAKGELVLYKEAGKIKIGRGVNSLTTTNQGKGESFKKIKVVDIMDMISNDLRETMRDNYIGKYANSYDNKCILITAINGYLDGLYNDGLVDNGYSVGINVEAQKKYLKSIGVDVASMSEQQIKEANTKDKVFLTASIKVLDAIEDIDLDFVI